MLQVRIIGPIILSAGLLLYPHILLHLGVHFIGVVYRRRLGELGKTGGPGPTRDAMGSLCPLTGRHAAVTPSVRLDLIEGGEALSRQPADLVFAALAGQVPQV